MKKKNGFTLAETLVTLGIIGVIAAILIPLIGKARPDEAKVMYLKAYDSLTDAVSYFVKDSAYYPHVIEFQNGGNDYTADVSRFPLLNINNTPQAQHQAVTGETKLCTLIAEAMNGQNVNCAATATANDGTINWATPSFTTQNGMVWIIGADAATRFPAQNAAGNWESFFLNNVYVKPKADSNEVYKFSITADGKIHIMDPVGAGYVNSRTNLKRTSVHDQVNGAVDAIANNVFSVPVRLETIVAQGGGGGAEPNGGGEEPNNGDDDDDDIIKPDLGSGVTKEVCENGGGLWKISGGCICLVTKMWSFIENKCVDKPQIDPDKKKRCENRGGHWYQGECIICGEKQAWTGKKCEDCVNDEDPRKLQCLMDRIN